MGCGAPNGSSCNEAIIAAAKCQTTELSLRDVSIKGKSLGQLAKALERNSSLTLVRLVSCGLGDKDVAKIAGALASRRCLTLLDLSCNLVEDDGVKCIAAALWAASSPLTELLLWDNRIERGGAALAACGGSLTRLSLGYNGLGRGAGRFAAALEDNTILRDLNLWHNGIQEDGLAAIAKALSKNTSVTSLALSRNRWGPTVAAQFAISLKDNLTLKSLDLKNCFVKDVAAVQLGVAIEQSRSLESLDLYDNDIAGFASRRVAAALAARPPLTYLNLSSNKVGDAGATMLALALGKNDVLLELNLWNNAIGDFGATCLAAGLRRNKALTTLGLKRNIISEACVDRLATNLEQNTTLIELQFEDEDIGEERVERIQEILRRNRWRQENSTDDHGAENGRDAEEERTCETAIAAPPDSETSDLEWAGYLSYLIYNRADCDKDFNGTPLEVAPGLYLGDCEVALNIAGLQACGIDRVLCMAPVDCGGSDLRGYPSTFITLDIFSEDTGAYDIFMTDVPQALDFIEMHINDGRRVLVHCFAGQNRSATVCAAWSLRARRTNLCSIVENLAAERGPVLLNPRFRMGLVAMARAAGLLGDA